MTTKHRLPYYECHITVEGTNAADVTKMKSLLAGTPWHFSAINGDPHLGPGVKLYATAHFPSGLPGGTALNSAIMNLRDMAGSLALSGLKVIREKVEMVVYDTKENS